MVSWIDEAIISMSELETFCDGDLERNVSFLMKALENFDFFLARRDQAGLLK